MKAPFQFGMSVLLGFWLGNQRCQLVAPADQGLEPHTLESFERLAYLGHFQSQRAFSSLHRLGLVTGSVAPPLGFRAAAVVVASTRKLAHFHLHGFLEHQLLS